MLLDYDDVYSCASLPTRGARIEIVPIRAINEAPTVAPHTGSED